MTFSGNAPSSLGTLLTVTPRHENRATAQDYGHMKEIDLPHFGGTATLQVLGDSDLKDVLALHEVTRNALPADMKMFVLPQPESYFRNLLSGRAGTMIGIRANGKLVAQIALKGPVTLREAIAHRDISKNEILYHHAAMNDHVVIFKSMSVHPDWRGNDLSKYLLGYAVEQPVMRLADHAFAQISANNRRSWDVFIRAGFCVVAAAYDPQDGNPRFVMQRPTFGFDLDTEVIADDVDCRSDFAAIVNLTQRDALVGLFGADPHGNLVFHRSNDDAYVLPTVARVKAG